MTRPDQVSALVTDMFSQSLTVMTRPSVQTFEQFERRGGMVQALTYMAIAGLAVGVLSLLSGGKIYGLIAGILITPISFFIFTYMVYTLGKAWGGTGKLDEVAYTFSLFRAPLEVFGALVGLVVFLLKWIPLVNVLVGLSAVLVGLIVMGLSIYYGYLAVRSSMNFYRSEDTMKVVGIMVLSAVATGVLSGIVVRILL